MRIDYSQFQFHFDVSVWKMSKKKYESFSDHQVSHCIKQCCFSFFRPHIAFKEEKKESKKYFRSALPIKNLPGPITLL